MIFRNYNRIFILITNMIFFCFFIFNRIRNKFVIFFSFMNFFYNSKKIFYYNNFYSFWFSIRFCAFFSVLSILKIIWIERKSFHFLKSTKSSFSFIRKSSIGDCVINSSYPIQFFFFFMFTNIRINMIFPLFVSKQNSNISVNWT